MWLLHGRLHSARFEAAERPESGGFVLMWQLCCLKNFLFSQLATTWARAKSIALREKRNAFGIVRNAVTCRHKLARNVQSSQRSFIMTSENVQTTTYKSPWRYILTFIERFTNPKVMYVFAIPGQQTQLIWIRCSLYHETQSSSVNSKNKIAFVGDRKLICLLSKLYQGSLQEGRSWVRCQGLARSPRVHVGFPASMVSPCLPP